jgi:DNA-binding LacI/PurR family transcriptional regulator
MVSTQSPHGRTPTMADVAAAAGVSKALVSIVFRSAPGASDKTRARVFAAAESLGYRANRTASMLKLRRTKHLGVTMSARNAFHAELIEALQHAANREGYEVVLSTVTTEHPERRAVETLLEFRCESIILLGTDLPRAELSVLADTVPVVLVGRRVGLTNLDVVRAGDDRGMALLVEHLVGLGHTEIAQVDGGRHPIAKGRRSGFNRAARRHEHAAQTRTVAGGGREADGWAAASTLLESDRLPSAVVAFNDHCAVGVLDRFSRAGVRVPSDVSVTGYDDSLISQFAAIDLTTVNQEPERQAEWAVRAAVGRLEGLRTEPGEEVLTPRLVVRGSTGPALTKEIQHDHA